MGSRVIGLYVLLGLLGLLNCNSIAAAQSPQPLRLLESTKPQALLVDIDRDGKLIFQTPDERISSAPEEIVCWQRAKIITSHTSAALSDGSWLSGRIVWKSSSTLQLVSDWFEPLELKLDQLRAIIVQPSPSVQQTIELQSQLLTHSGAADQVWRSSGEPISGVLQSALVPSKVDNAVSEIDWKIQPDKADQPVSLARQEVRAVVFSPALRAALPKESAHTLVTLTDTSRLRVSRFYRLADGRAELQLDCGIKLTTLDAAEEFVLAVVEVLGDSPRIQWLSDIEPTRYRLLDSHSRVPWPLGRNRDLFNKRLFVGELPIEKALVVHAPAQVAYRYDGQPGRLLATLSLWSEATTSALPPPPGSAKVQVLLGKNNNLVTAYQSPPLEVASELSEIDVDLSGAQLIVLLVESTDSHTLGDHVLLRELRVVKDK